MDILAPVIDRVEVISVENERGMATKEILDICKNRGIETKLFQKIEEGREYLVFGSFMVVEKFLGDIN